MSLTPEAIARAKRGILLVGGPMAGFRIDPMIVATSRSTMTIELTQPHKTACGSQSVHKYRLMLTGMVGFYTGRKEGMG